MAWRKGHCFSPEDSYDDCYDDADHEPEPCFCDECGEQIEPEQQSKYGICMHETEVEK